MPNIAIVGTEGSGKTVFTAVLAKHFSGENPLGVFMDPQGRHTVDYVERVWHTLMSGEWPASTAPGALFDLHWTVHAGERVCGDIRLVDCAGQDLRLLFADEQAESPGIPEHLRQLADYCRSARIILFMINLRDFVGESDDERRTANEWAIKSVLDHARRDTRQNGQSLHVALVFTQVDQYQDELQRHGDWRGVIKEHLPYVYGAHLQDDRVTTLSVAAVADTQVVTDGPIPRRVPARMFRSLGLDEMMSWIGEQLSAIGKEDRQSLIDQAQAEWRRRTTNPTKAERRSDLKRKLLTYVKCFVAVMVLMFLIRMCIGPDHSPSAGSNTTTPAVTEPILAITAKTEHDIGTGEFQKFGHEVTVRVTNSGASGYVDVTCTFNQAGHSYPVDKVDLIPADWHCDFTFHLTAGLFQDSGPVTTDVSARVAATP